MSSPPHHSARDEGSAPASATAKRRFLAHMRAADSYGLVLILIIASYALAVSLHGVWAPSVVLFAQIVTVWFALRTSNAKRGVLMLAGVLLLVAGAVGIVALFAGTTRHPLTLVFLVSCLLYTIAPISIVRHIAFRQEVDEETMLGAICAYLLIGMAFAFLYVAIARFQASPFFGSNGDGTIGQDLFFTFTTLSTTGYGNLVPAGQPGQSLAVAEMILGQLFLITAVGKIVSAWRPRAWKSEEEG